MADILARFQRRQAGTESELEAMRRAAWLGQGVIAVRPDDITDVWLRQALINFAEARYGKRSADAAGQTEPADQIGKTEKDEQ